MNADRAVNGHADRAVTIETVDGCPRVVKHYVQADAASVAGSMAALWASPFGRRGYMPEPISIDGGRLVMSFVPGEAIGARGDLGSVPQRLDDIAALLVSLHGSGAVVPRQRHAGKLIRSLGRKAHDIAPDLRSIFGEAVAALDDARPDRERLLVNHGDFSPRNLLDAGSQLVLIDFDRLQMAGAGRDVGYLAAWCWATTLQCDGAGDWAIGEAFGDAYRHAGGVSISRAQMRFHRACALLRIAQSWSALAHTPETARQIIEEAHRQVTQP